MKCMYCGSVISKKRMKALKKSSVPTCCVAHENAYNREMEIEYMLEKREEWTKRNRRIDEDARRRKELMQRGEV